MSGGLDSSLSAYVLKEKGYDIFGLTMKHLDYGDEEKLYKPCCSLEDILDAKRVCNHLGIPHYTLNFKDIFKEKIIDNFIDEYKKGNTPNPCVKCNREVKIGYMIEQAIDLGASYLATGHYSTIKDGKLYAAKDNFKDQSYFLSQVKKDDLEKMILPLGDITKEEAKQLARDRNILIREKSESQGVCFINNDYKKFLNRELTDEYKKPGNIIDLKGEVLGKHEGVHNYTIGQRRGIGVSSEYAYYVVGINPNKNEVVIGKDSDLFTKSLKCNRVNLFVNLEELKGREVFVKTRARDMMNIATIEDIGEDILTISFRDKVRAITKGQYAVIYNNDFQVLGSGIIL